MVDNKKIGKTNENGLYDFEIDVDSKGICLDVIGKVLEQAEEAGDSTHPAVVGVASLAEKLINTMDAADLELTLEELIAMNGVDIIIGTIITGKSSEELMKERYAKG